MFNCENGQEKRKRLLIMDLMNMGHRITYTVILHNLRLMCRNIIWGKKKIENLEIFQRVCSNHFQFPAPNHILRFSYHDGIIDELCPEPDEPNWVMNFKRGILSSFQNTMKRFDIDFKSTETDISGTCGVEYVVQGAQGTSFVVMKNKDISSCINRYKTNSILQTTPYDFRKQYSVWPVLQSTSYCKVSDMPCHLYFCHVHNAISVRFRFLSTIIFTRA